MSYRNAEKNLGKLTKKNLQPFSGLLQPCVNRMHRKENPSPISDWVRVRHVWIRNPSLVWPARSNSKIRSPHGWDSIEIGRRTWVLDQVMPPPPLGTLHQLPYLEFELKKKTKKTLVVLFIGIGTPSGILAPKNAAAKSRMPWSRSIRLS